MQKLKCYSSHNTEEAICISKGLCNISSQKLKTKERIVSGRKKKSHYCTHSHSWYSESQHFLEWIFSSLVLCGFIAMSSSDLDIQDAWLVEPRRHIFQLHKLVCERYWVKDTLLWDKWFLTTFCAPLINWHTSLSLSLSLSHTHTHTHTRIHTHSLTHSCSWLLYFGSAWGHG